MTIYYKVVHPQFTNPLEVSHYEVKGASNPKEARNVVINEIRSKYKKIKDVSIIASNTKLKP